MVKTLVDICTTVCIKNVRDIWDVGSLPYWVARPILLKIENPAQLKEIEERSPHLKGDTIECWQRFINRDFPQLARRHNYEPRNPALWSKIYQKYKALDAELKAEAAAKLNNGFNALKKEKQAKAVPVMNFNAKIHGRIPGQRRNGSDFHGMSFGAPRPKSSSLQSIFQKARRDASITRRHQLATPTGQLIVPRGQIARAPMGMVEEHRNKSRPFARAIHPPSRPAGARQEREQKEREARLLKAKSGSNAKETTIVSDEDLLAQVDVDSDFDSDGDAGGLTVNELESILDGKKATTPTSSSPTKGPSMSLQSKNASSTASPSSTTAKPDLSNLSGLAKMKMGRSWRDRPMRLEPIETPSSKPTTSSPAASKSSTALSPPLRPFTPSKQPSSLSPPPGATVAANGASSPSADPNPKPKPRPMVIGQKRKEGPSIFMKPKNKARRMS
ncbi:RNA polymerase II transcription factor SIII subunit A-domain-containing protein [Hypoxylon sp. FL1857]|nr:RNA polymerase II transcription factor SIII subunit A-domain-containing protein [Hypoxylon sp. FL1857]